MTSSPGTTPSSYSEASPRISPAGEIPGLMRQGREERLSEKAISQFGAGLGMRPQQEAATVGR